MRWLTGLLLIGFATLAWAYIPSSKMILERNLESNQKLPLYFEADIELTQELMSLHFREYWMIENDQSIHIAIQGDGDLKNQFQTLIVGTKSKHNNKPTSLEYFMPLFYSKSLADVSHLLAIHGIVPSNFLSLKHFSKDFNKRDSQFKFEYTPEPYLRYGRTAGLVNYVLGPAPKSDSKPAGLWIDQDQFLIRKFRSQQQSEIVIEKYASYRGQKVPKEMTVSWGMGRSAHIVLTDIRIPSASHKTFFSKVTDFQNPAYLSHPGKVILEDFLARFR